MSDMNDIPEKTDDLFLRLEDSDFSELLTEAKKRADLTSVNNLKDIAISALKKICELKDKSIKEDEFDKLISYHNSSVGLLGEIFSASNEELQFEAFKALIDLLPHQIVVNKKSSFPDQNFADILKLVILSKNINLNCIQSIKELLKFPDISRNIWKALDIACKGCNKFGSDEVKNVLELINVTEKPKSKETEEVGPQPYFCLTEVGVIEEKDIARCIKRIWDKLVSVDLQPKLLQSLLLSLHERLMPRMKRPIFLTDFFMTTLEYGGSISILSLQGIFHLYKDENMNYPDVYEKLYSMVTPELFVAQYKARFYYLTDIFLSSSHLPEALVASFIKKFARLSLLAPPPDAIILLTCIVNLLIRHRGLKRLIHNPAVITYESDPYRADESDPSLTGAVNSSLWEVQLLEAHAIPSVSSAASFIRRPLPSVEADLSSLLETTAGEMFQKEHKKKMKTPPVCFEKPHSLFGSNNISHLWNLSA